MANSKKGTKQVNPPTPKQRVNSAFGSKKGLVNAIVELVGDNDAGFKSSLMQVSNKRLMSHHHNAKRMVAQFGSKDGAVTAICSVRFPKGNVPEGYREQLEGYSAWRLMDEHRQALGAVKAEAKAKAAAEKLRVARLKRREKVRARRAARNG